MTGFAEYLRKGGYRTHYVGKWDAGMATPKHTPFGRGYETSLHYFEHKNDYFTQECAQSKCCKESKLSSSSSSSSSHLHERIIDPPSPFQNLTLVDLWDTDKPARHLNGTDYEEFLFLDRMMEILDHHDAQEPLLLFYAPHVAHCPLQVPQEYLDKFDFITNDSQLCRAQTENIVPADNHNHPQPPVYSCRKQYRAMVNLLDDIIGKLVGKFRERGLWDNTLMVFTSDNGGPVGLRESGATNYDLRGGKYSDWEGGVRATAFVSGGYVPRDRRGSVVDEPVHICDWYLTLPKLAGIEVPRKESEDSELPAIDSVDIWPLLLGETEKSPRKEIPLSNVSLIVGDYKIIWHDSVQIAGWSGPDYPDSSSSREDVELRTMNCSTGCLFNVAEDRGEHKDLAALDPIRTEAMKVRLLELKEGFFENDDRGADACPSEQMGMPCACWMALNYYGGYMGPFQEIDAGAGVQKQGVVGAVDEIK